ncbi:MAG: class F sortase, partial [Candidatus Saccharimonadales bacterium]
MRNLERLFTFKVRVPRFLNKLRLDYGFSILLIVAGLLGTAVNLFPPSDVTNTQVSSATLPAQEIIANPSMSPAIPNHLEIPAIGVSTGLITLGKNTDGTLETPDAYDVAGWYKYSPTPG